MINLDEKLPEISGELFEYILSQEYIKQKKTVKLIGIMTRRLHDRALVERLLKSLGGVYEKLTMSGKRPKFDMTDENTFLLNALKDLGYIKRLTENGSKWSVLV